MKLNVRNIFLLDGTGAALSAVSMGFLLPLFRDLIGLPTWLLYSLASVGLVYAVYSFACYRFAKRIRSFMLPVIMTANLFYCLLLGAVAGYFKELTNLGLVLLIGEIIIILGLVVVEHRIYRESFRTQVAGA